MQLSACRRYGVTALLVIGGLAVLVASGGPALADMLRYEREAILDGQLWRLVTGNLVHLGWTHLLLNLAGLGLIGALFGQALSACVWTAAFLVCSLGVGAGLLLLNASIDWYVGLSGVLHGLFAVAALAAGGITTGTRTIMLVLLGSKLLFEQVYGSLPGTSAAAGGNVVVDAHMYGAIAGLVTGGIVCRRTRDAG